MENQSERKYILGFLGQGGDFFGVVIINWLLTVVTLGIYYPWAKARTLQFLYGNTTLENDRFTFHGTGREMFKGFIRLVGVLLLFWLLLLLCMYVDMQVLGTIIFYIGFLILIPFAIHGTYRYRMSRTSWRGIRLGYRGSMGELAKKYFSGLFFTIITLGIYGFWFSIDLRKYIIDHLRFGNLQFKYHGTGTDYFVINLKGYLLTLITLGIYFFWWQKDLFQFYINNITLNTEQQRIRLKSTATGGDIFVLSIVNVLILIFSLGLGYAWVITRTMTFMTNHIELNGDINLDTIGQTEGNYKDATGDEFSDGLDVDFLI